MTRKYTKKEILALKRRALEIADLFDEALDQEMAKLYVRYIEGKKEALFEKHLKAQREKQAERKKAAEERQKASSQQEGQNNTPSQ
ncbi:hypothetical protein VNN41_09950 [Lactococcus garvieae]|uniref:hypothetical protein n=1 Tax=Lactococcus garvieae TaxID=1363 RepID=UPI003251B29D